MKAVRSFDPGREPISDLILFEAAEARSLTEALSGLLSRADRALSRAKRAGRDRSEH